MAVVFDHGCLVTTVKNTSGEPATFSFLPPHGHKLAADEEMSFFGHLTEAVRRGDRFGSREANAMLAALDDGAMTIVSTPLTIAYDETSESSKTIGIDDGALKLSDPCWETSLSET